MVDPSAGVFPAHAGMNRAYAGKTAGSVPRTRGDEPANLLRVPPHTRG